MDFNFGTEEVGYDVVYFHVMIFVSHLPPASHIPLSTQEEDDGIAAMEQARKTDGGCFKIKAFKPQLVSIKNESLVAELKEAFAGSDYMPEIIPGDEGVGEPNLMKIRLQCCLGLSGNKASLVSSFGFIVIFGVMAEAKLFEIDWINSAILLRPWFLAFWTASKNGFSSLSSMTLENCSSLFGFASPISIKMLENSFLLIQSGSNLTSLRKIGLDVVDETCSWKAW
ncbi:hypothetical protein Tco_0845844 [Tanacetum coccineum]